MLDYFINVKEQQKLTMFQEILFSPDGMTTKELVYALDLSNETSRRYIKELTVDLKELFGDSVSLAEKSNKKIECHINDGLTLVKIISMLQLSYMKKNSLYSVLGALIKKEYSSINEIADDLNFSEPNVYKIIAQIKELLLPFEATIDLKGSNNFGGNEFGVRYFLYITYWNLYNSLETDLFPANFPKEFIDINFLKDNLGIKKELTHTQSIRLIMMAGIISYRLVKFNKQVEVDEEFINDIKFFYNGKACLNVSNYNIDPNVIEKESMVFNFLARGIIFDIDSSEEKTAIVKRFQNSNLAVASDIKNFLELFKKTFNLNYTEKNYIESYYLLIFTFIYVKHFHFKVDNYLRVSVEKHFDSFREKKQYQRLSHQFNELLKLFPFSYSVDTVDQETFTYLLYVIYEMNSTTEPIFIYVMNTSNIVNAAYIKTVISKFFNPDSIYFCDKPEQADLIISNAYEGLHTSVENFYFENIYNQETWKGLIEFISKVIFEKEFH